MFEMREGGLVEVTNPSGARGEHGQRRGFCHRCDDGRHASDPLWRFKVSPPLTQFGNARRTANGVDFNRLLLISLC
ncbi:MAG: hypothetical protein U0X93_00795 [Anaerolineales bacterium]